jgi:hypothetical protein
LQSKFMFCNLHVCTFLGHSTFKTRHFLRARDGFCVEKLGIGLMFNVYGCNRPVTSVRNGFDSSIKKNK